MEKRNVTSLSLILVVLILVGIIFASRIDFSTQSKKVLWKERPLKENAPKVDKFKRPDSFVELIKREKPAVVNISTTQVLSPKKFHPWENRDRGGNPNPFDDFFDKFFEDMPKSDLKRQSLGSGFIISNDGYILTNNHVIENATKIKVTLSDGREYEAKVIGRDPKTDIALIKISSNGSLPVAYLGDSDKVEVGEWVVAIGNPFGLGQTVTAGIVSAKGRVIGIGNYDNFIQTDASINPGNSGGPLFDISGEVVGINTAIVASGQGIGFATPINMAKEILKSLKEEGSVTRGWLGVNIQQVDETIAKTFNLKDTKGALVGDIIADTPAEKAGIKRGDVILEFNGKKVDSYHDLPRIVASTKIGSVVDVILMRNGETKVLKVQVEELKDDLIIKSSTQIADKLGLTVTEVYSLEERRSNTPPEGVLIKGVRKGSLAEENDLRVGDVILEINKEKLTNVKDYEMALKKIEKNNHVIMLIKREGRTFFASIKLR